MHSDTVPNPPPRLIKARELPKLYPFLNYARLRHLLTRRDVNGLDRAVVRLGRLLLIDQDEFDAWLIDQRERRAS